MPAPASVLELVKRFEEQYDSYRSPAYNETQVRREFVDPFLKALGWDVDNEQGYAEAYKDVIHEDAIKIGASTKAPDYSLRIGGIRKFFVETKKPSVNIQKDPSPAFQLRRYAWSAKLPVSVLTDFEEFAVYDCRIRPDQKDKASTARTLYMKFTEYEDRWEEVATVFSREAILKGSFDKYAESTKRKRGTAEVDDAFLKEIETWRADLARNLALRNHELSQRELNFAVQKTIDRIIFLRICEDRGIEPYGNLKSLGKVSGIYAELTKLFRQADDRYNSGLFHFTKEKTRPETPDNWTLALKIDDKVLKDIIRHLYYPESPYEFSVLPADILGQVYEQFLGKVIRLTSGHQAKIEDKPEVKKAGGVFYTPTYVVDYIVENTVGKLVAGRTPFEIAARTEKTWKPAKGQTPLTVLDPACGSGSFLIGAYQFLIDWYRDWYVKNGPEKHKDRIHQTRKDQWRLTTAERKRILLDHIFGVDIDPQAVEVTKLSLLLKVLEGENQETLEKQLKLFHERALPDLAANIKCGNSLIASDFYQGKQFALFDEEEQLRINAFDWKAEFAPFMRSGGFDVVIGNPPYDVLEKDRGNSSWPHSALSEYVRFCPEYAPSLGGKLNLFRFFVARSLKLVRLNGRFGNILPLALLADISCANIRQHLMLNGTEILCDCFPQKDDPNRRIFVRAKLSTVVVTCQRWNVEEQASAKLKVRVYPWNSLNDPFTEATFCLFDSRLLDPKNVPIPLVDANHWEVCRRIHQHPKVKRLGEIPDFEVRRGEINQTIFRQFISDDPGGARMLKGVEVGPFRLNEKLSQGKREWFDEAAFHVKSNPKPITQLPRIATQRITGVDERLRIVATLIAPPMYFADSTNSISLTDKSVYDLRYLLGLLNSKLFQWRFKITSTNNNVGTNELDSMPIRVIDFKNKNDKEHHTQLVNLVEHILSLNDRLRTSKAVHEKTVIQRQIESTKQKIDEFVYALYELTEDEIRVIESPKHPNG